MNIALLARKTLYTQSGGDTVQVLKTAEALENRGHRVAIVLAGEELPSNLDVLHGFNLGRPADLLRYFKAFNGKKVLSSIFVDYSLADSEGHPFLFRLLGQHGMEWIKTIARGLNGTDRMPEFSYLLRGQKAYMNSLLRLADTFITSSTSELMRIQQWAKIDGRALRDKHTVVPLGILDDFTSDAQLDTPKKGLLIVGRLERLKNQKKVMLWARENGWPLTVVGDPNTNQPKYYQQCQELVNEHVSMIPYKDVKSLIELMDKHKVLVIPSSFETYSLVGWEAAARGMVVVANDVADMTDTLEGVAHKVNFTNSEEACAAIQCALEGKLKKKSQVQFENFTWDSIGQKIEQLYL